MFSIYGKLFNKLVKAGDFFLLAILGVIFSLPIFSIGASITAVFYVGMKLVRDEESYVFKDFIKSWKMNLKQGFFIELILGVVTFLLVEDIRICMMYADNGNEIARVFMFISLGILLVVISVIIYSYGMLAKFDNTVISTIKNALVIGMHHFPQTFIILIIDCVLIVFSVKYFTAFIVTIPIIIYVDSYILSRIFLIYVKQSIEQSERENTKEE